MILPTGRHTLAEAVAALVGTDIAPLLAVKHSPPLTFLELSGNVLRLELASAIKVK